MATAWKMIWRPLRISLQFFRGKLIGMGMFLPHRIVWYIVWYRLRPRFTLSILIAFLLISPYVSHLFSLCGMCRTPASVFPALPSLALPLWSSAAGSSENQSSLREHPWTPCAAANDWRPMQKHSFSWEA